MNKKILTLIAIVIAAALFAGAYFLYDSLSADNESEGETTTSAPDETDEGPVVGEWDNTAPSFTVYDAEGNAVTNADLLGKPVVLNFWTSLSESCKAELEVFEAAYKANSDVQFIILNVTAKDSKEDAEALIADNGFTFPVYFDLEGTTAKHYAATSYPTTCFINSEGKIVNYKAGALNSATLEGCIAEIKD